MSEAPTEETPILDIENLDISYTTRKGKINAVLDFNLKLEKGNSIGIVGESGCGKTTVLLAMMNYLGKNGSIDSGNIKFMGQSMLSMSEKELTDIRGNKIAMIYQEPMSALNPCLLIGEQLLEVLKFHSPLSTAEAKVRCIETLHDVRLPDPERIMACYPHQISGGQQQRIVIAMALLSRPSLLLLDEPTTALDVTVEFGIIKLIAELSRKYGSSMIYISHNMGLIRQTCNDIIVMYSGQVVETGPTEQVFMSPNHPYSQGLLKCIPSPAHDANERSLTPIRGQLPPADDRPQGCFFAPRCEFFLEGTCDNQNGIPISVLDKKTQLTCRCARIEDLDNLSRTKTQDSQRRIVDHNKVKKSQPLLKIENLQKNYQIHSSIFSSKGGQTIKANKNINLEVFKGDIVSIVGESGCGKTTLAKILLGLEEPTSGKISFQHHDISESPVHSRPPDLIGNMQMIFQNPNETLNPAQSVGYQVMRAVKKFNPKLSHGQVKEKAFKLFDMVSLSPEIFFDRLPMHLSGGQKQRIGISRAFAGNPSIIIADEPVSALDVSVQSSIIELLHELQLHEHISLLVISHDLSLVRYLSDFIIVMYLGQILERGPVKAVFEPPYSPYTEALLAAVPIADASISKRDDVVLDGNLPSPTSPPKGCPLATRCHRKIQGLCDDQPPPIRQISHNHEIACHLSIEELSKIKPVFSLKDKSTKNI